MKQKRWSLSDILSILNTLPHGVALLGCDLEVKGMNHQLEALTGHASAAVAGISVDMVLRSSLSHRNPLPAQALASDVPAVAEGDLLTADRRKIPARFTLTPFGNDSEDGGLVLVVEDLSQVRELEKQRGGPRELAGVIGYSPKLREVLEFVPVLAGTDATVLITGETGTGKDLLAEAIHNASRRAGHPFVKVNCGALPEALLESELFGHARGAFTGAHTDKPGMFRLAQGGTLFLTEIGDLPLPLQVKLLTVLDDRAFYPVGGSKKVEVDVRVITGTHRNLKELVEQGRFRQDLYYRLNVLNVHLPALRERDGDVRLLADHFLGRFATSLQRNIRGFSSKAMEMLRGYGYPGNVRELRNIVEYAVSVCQGGEIGVEHLPEAVAAARATRSGVKAVPAPLQQPLPGNGTLPAESIDPLANEANWLAAEKKMVMDALLRSRGNRGEAARLLGWGRSTLWRKMKQHGIAP